MTASCRANKTDIITDMSLQFYFQEKLAQSNQKLKFGMSEETIFYLGHMMSDFSGPGKFFELNGDRVNFKILGRKFLEVQSLDHEEKKTGLRDIGDTSLFLCGFFASSIKRKILSVDYYKNLGKNAYAMLNHSAPEHCGVADFFKSMSQSFDGLVFLISLISQENEKNNSNLHSHTMIKNLVFDKNNDAGKNKLSGNH